MCHLTDGMSREALSKALLGSHGRNKVLTYGSSSRNILVEKSKFRPWMKCQMIQTFATKSNLWLRSNYEIHIWINIWGHREDPAVFFTLVFLTEAKFLSQIKRGYFWSGKENEIKSLKMLSRGCQSENRTTWDCFTRIFLQQVSHKLASSSGQN